MKFKMNVNEICNYLVEEIKLNAEGLRNSNCTITDQAKSIGEILLASALLSRIFETFDEDAPITEEASQVHTEEPAEEVNVMKAARLLQDYCKANTCPTCPFYAGLACCEFGNESPYNWKLWGEDE